MPKVWSLVQNVTKDWTSFQNVTKKASKICPKFGHFFKMCPRSCQRLGHYLEIFKQGDREKRTRESLTMNCMPLTPLHVVTQELCNNPAVRTHFEGLDVTAAVLSGGPLADCGLRRPQSAGCVLQWKSLVHRSRCRAETCAKGHPTCHPLVRGQRGIHCYAKIGTSAMVEETLMVLLPTLYAAEWACVEQ